MFTNLPNSSYSSQLQKLSNPILKSFHWIFHLYTGQGKIQIVEDYRPINLQAQPKIMNLTWNERNARIWPLELRLRPRYINSISPNKHSQKSLLDNIINHLIYIYIHTLIDWRSCCKSLRSNQDSRSRRFITAVSFVYINPNFYDFISFFQDYVVIFV